MSAVDWDEFAAGLEQMRETLRAIVTKVMGWTAEETGK